MPIRPMCRITLAALLLTACRSSEAAPVEHSPVTLDQAQRTALDRFVGSWQHVGGAAEQEAALDSVREVTDQMNSFIRGMAESRLSEAVQIDAGLTVSEQEGIVTLARSEQPKPFTAPADGTGFDMQTADGDDARGSLRIDGHTLVTRVETGDGGSERTHRIDAQGKLVISTRTFSPRLPADVVYQATYERR
jgi:hypothetical protein